MTSQRPSTSKKKAHAGASRKKMDELLNLAKDIKEESVFQHENRYKKFKKQNHTISPDDLPIWGHLLNELCELNFHHESIFWANKILEDVRLSDSSYRSVAFCSIVRSYFKLHDFENSSKYGEKYLTISSEMKKVTSEERDLRRNILLFMQETSRKLNRPDEFQYPKKILDLDVFRYDAREIDKSTLLQSYSNFIRMQNEFGNFQGALKTLEDLKLFSLDSMNSSDTINAMKNEGYGKVFPLNDLLNNSAVRDVNKLASKVGNIWFLSPLVLSK